MFIFTARKRSLGQGNIFAPVCHSVHRGEYMGRYPLGRYITPGRYTPRQVHPRVGTPRQVYLPARYTPLIGTPGRYIQRQVHPKAGTPPGRYTPWQVHPLPGRYTPLDGYITLWADTPPRQVHPLHARIRSTSGGYAPYWNAFLLYLCSKIYFHRVFRKIKAL